MVVVGSTWSSSQARFVGFATFGALLHVVSQLIDQYVPQPYMDEIFHVPQAQAFCRGQWQHWDDKITTFPGLYVAAVGINSVASRMFGDGYGSCSVSALRSVNLLFSFATAIVLERFMHARRALAADSLGHSGAAAPWLRALALAMFPPHFFFAFLFYTDAISTFFVLLTLKLFDDAARCGGHGCSGVLGATLAAGSGTLSIACRQTNAVWLIFGAGAFVVADLEGTHGEQLIRSGADVGNGQRDGQGLLPAPAVVLRCASLVWKEWRRLQHRVLPALLVALAFVVFVVWNKGIVVGDRSNHTMVLHFAQLGYFSVFAASYLAALHRPSALWRNTADLVAEVSRRKFMTCVVVIVIASLLWFGSPTHPFILADNRHYTFYVWKAFFRRHRFAKLLPLPAYATAAWLLSRALRLRSSAKMEVASRPVSSLWLLGFVVALSLVLVPAHLVEPRYFLVPFFIVHVHAEPASPFHTCLLLLAGVVVNAVVLGVFIFRPFTWPDESVARFMW